MTLAELRENGPFAWPGGYPLIAVMDDGEALCIGCIKREVKHVHEGGDADGWRYEGADIYWEGPPLVCAHCYAEIESAYGDPDTEGEAR